MDPVINSLVQSPLVRSLSSVPSKASSFVHGLRDMVPPFSYQKVVVTPYNLSETTGSHDRTHKFRIPQFGTLNRAYLRVKLKNKSSGLPWLITDTETARTGRRPWFHQVEQRSASASLEAKGGSAYELSATATLGGVDAENISNHIQDGPFVRHGGTSSNSWNAVKAIKNMTLQTHNKIIETIPGDTIPTEVERMPQGLRDFYRQGMVGWSSGDPTSGLPTVDYHSYNTPFDPSRCVKNSVGVIVPCHSYFRNDQADFIVPVTLSSLKTMTKNYQTRFVEDLELHVETKDFGMGHATLGAAAVAAVNEYVVELVLLYHNWHDNIENSLRNSNYKRGIPASIYSTNWYTEAPSTYSSVTGHTVNLSCRNLATEILVVGRYASNTFKYSDSAANQGYGFRNEYTDATSTRDTWNVTFSGSGKTIWEGTNLELQGPDTEDYDLVDRRLRGGSAAHSGGSMVPVSGYYESAQVAPNAGVVSGVANSHATQSGVLYGFGNNMFTLRFGMQTTDEYYTGGIALQTISNPKLVISRFGSPGGGQQPASSEYQFRVYVKYSNLVRIDSDTGAITRTLDV